MYYRSVLDQFIHVQSNSKTITHLSHQNITLVNSIAEQEDPKEEEEGFDVSNKILWIIRQ